MGRDKAFLPWQGRPLWEHQLEKLRALAPQQLLLSCREEQAFPVIADVEPVADAVPDSGPLGGIAACLEKCQAPLLVVLGIDLPHLPVPLLETLLAASGAHGAVVQQQDESGTWFEPLAAVYPVAMLSAARDQLAQGQLALQAFIRRGIADGHLRVLPAPAEAAAWFLNWNRPEDGAPQDS